MCSGLTDFSTRKDVLNAVKHYLPLRRTMRCPPEKRRPTICGKVEAGFCQQQSQYILDRKGRYGGRAERRMNTSLRGGMLAIGLFLALKIPIPRGVSGLADEDICFQYVG